MEVRQLVGDFTAACGPDEPLRVAAKRMFAEGVGSLAVLVAGSLEGIVTERDITRAAADGVDFEEATVGEYMSSPADSIGPDADVTEAAEWLLATGYRHLPIVDDGRLVGIASIKDVLWAVAEAKSTKQ